MRNVIWEYNNKGWAQRQRIRCVKSSAYTRRECSNGMGQNINVAVGSEYENRRDGWFKGLEPRKESMRIDGGAMEWEK